MKKIKSLFLPFVTILVVVTSNAGCKKSGGKSSEATITAFSFATPVATGTIAGLNISLTVPAGTPVTALIATFTLSNGATATIAGVLQVSGETANDFTSPVEYIVTAQDGITINKFNVTVNFQTETSKEITAFSFESLTPAVAGIISGLAITVELPAGTPVTNLIATFATTGATVKIGDVLQVSGTTANNFTNSVTYTVTAKDGTTQNYTVTVTGPKLSDKKITAFAFDGLAFATTVTIDEANHAIAVGVRTGTDVTALKATFTTTGASVKIGDVLQVSGTTTNDFTTPKTYTVTAQDNSTHNYTVTVTGPATTKEITAFSFDKLAFATTVTIDEANHAIAVSVRTGTDVTKLVATFTTTGVSVKANGNAQTSGITVTNFASPVTYTVTAQDNTTKDYTVTVTATDAKYVVIPDVNFREYLKSNLLSAFGTGDNADKLNVYDNSVTSLKSMNCNGISINDLTGIEYFVGLTSLDIYSNSVESLDVSKNTALTNLSVTGNKLTSLDLSKNTALINLSCSGNSLTTLDVSRNTALTYISCYNNKLNSLDLSKNTALINLSCKNNKLTSLDISSQTSWTTLTIYSDPVGADENLLTTLKVNVAQKDNAEVKKVKTNRGTNVTISTYTNNSTEVPVSSDYTPQ